MRTSLNLNARLCRPLHTEAGFHPLSTGLTLCLIATKADWKVGVVPRCVDATM